MDRIGNPLFTREFKTACHISKLIPALIVRFVLLAAIFPLVLLLHIGKGLLAMTLAETIIVLFFAPGAVIRSFGSREGFDDICSLSLTRLSSVNIVSAKFAGTLVYNFLFVIISTAGMFTLSFARGNFSVWLLGLSTVTLAVFAIAAAAIGMASINFFRRNALAAGVLSYTLVVLLVGGVVMAGPFIEHTQNRNIKHAIASVALHVNPVVIASRSLGTVDIMRTRYMYVVADPIVGPGFTYPDWGKSILIYIVFSCLLLVGAFASFRYHRQCLCE